MTEMPRLFAIALPLITAYLAELAMFATTRIVVGDLGYQQLAAVGLAGNLAFEVLVILLGLLSIVGVLAAQANGAGPAHKHKVGQAARQGFVVATALGVPATLLIWNLDTLFAAAGQPPEVVALTSPFLHGLSGFFLPALYFAVLRNYAAALARTGAVMVITLIAVGVNYLLTLGLVHGAFGLPALGIVGAGLALTIVSWAMFLALLAYIRWQPALRGYSLFAAPGSVVPLIDITLCAEILRLGIPIAGVVALEAGLFVAVALLSGLFGAAHLAAFDILLSWIGIPFVIALGLAEATMVRVAFGVGRGRPDDARRAGLLGMLVGMVIVASLVVVPLNFSEQIVRVFIDPSDPGYTEVAALVSQFIVIVAVFQVFDGLQAIASRALRGIKDTTAPLWIAAVGYWLLGIGGGSALAFPLGLGGVGLWWGLAAGLIVTATLLTLRFHWLTRASTGSRSVSVT